MQKLYVFVLALFTGFTAFGQVTTLDISALNATYTTTFDSELVIDVATATSAIAAPAVSIINPFYGEDFTEAEISFDVYNYNGTDSIKVLGCLISVFDAVLGRMYFTNGSYLGFNVGVDDWFDANLLNYAIDTDFIGGNEWKHIQLQFTATGYAMYVDGDLAYDEASTDVTIMGALTDYSKVIDFLKSATTIAIGTGSWWSDNISPGGYYWDTQYSYMKNIKFTQDFSTVSTFDLDANVSLGKLIRTDYYNLNGINVGADLEALSAGIYVKVETYDSGKIRSTKFFQSDQY